LQCKVIEIDSNKYLNKPHITYYLGDVHEGAANHTAKQFKRAIEIIKSDGDAWIGLGDYVDAINHNDPRFNPQEIADNYAIKDLEDLPRIQSNRFIENVKPIADKCLGVIYGNHEDSYRQHNTFDVVSYMCQTMNWENLRHKAWISFNFKRNNKSVPIKAAICHGAGGGGMREGYPINKAYDVFRWDMADIHVMGHLHQMVADRAEYNQFTMGKMRSDKVWFAVNGCFIAKSTFGNDGYFEQRPGKESGIGIIKQTILTSWENKSDFKIRLEPVFID